MKILRNISTFCVLSIASNIALSETQSAHVHGLADLTLAIENGALEIQLRSPAANLVGFEHKADTKEEIKSAKAAAARLAQPLSLFTFNDTKCEMLDTDVDVSAILDNEHAEDDHEEHKHKDHKHEYDEHARGHGHDQHAHETPPKGDHHEDEHDHAKHADEKHGHDEHKHGVHSEISATYSFSCGQNRELSSIEINFFEYFSGLEKINAMWVSDIGQGSSILTSNATELSLEN